MRPIHKIFFVSAFILCLGFYFHTSKAQSPKSENDSQPKLVVGIVVDQMRGDYINRFWNLFGEGGFKRLVNSGFNFENCQYNYVPTETAPGHASIFTGTTPSVHGIVQNTWVERGIYIPHSSVVDDKVKIVGEGKKRPCSPVWMLSTTIGDELKTSTGFKSKVVSVSIKDRGAILPGGKTADAAFWVDDSSAYFVSSSYYFKDQKLPEWVNQFNHRNLPAKYLAKGWNLSHPLSFYTAGNSAADAEYEYSFYPDSLPVFPYRFKPSPLSHFRYTSYGNEYVKEFAKQTVINYGLGNSGNTDLLAVSFSSPDYVGHKFGINSLELEETYVMLDAQLADFLQFLDSAIGQENILLFLTADHGAALNPKIATERHLPGGLIDMSAMRLGLRRILGDSPNGDSLLAGIYGHHIYLNPEVSRKRGKNFDSLCTQVAKYLENFPGISRALTATQLSNADFSDDMLSKLQNGFYPQRSGDVLFTFQSGWMEWDEKGTTHGSHYAYDCHVPLLFWGWKIKPGSDNRPVVIPDIAATVTSLLGINAPSGCTGKPLLK